jgi:hypothetical protein
MNKIVLMLTASAALLVSKPGYPQQVDTATQDPDAVNREFSLQRDAIGGKKSIFANYYSLKLDCSPTEWQQVKITKSPENGEARLVDMNTLAYYIAPNPRVKCNGKSVKSTALEYTPAKGYSGGDAIEVEAINDFGQRSVFVYSITVK